MIVVFVVRVIDGGGVMFANEFEKRRIVPFNMFQVMVNEHRQAQQLPETGVYGKKGEQKQCCDGPLHGLKIGIFNENGVGDVRSGYL